VSQETFPIFANFLRSHLTEHKYLDIY